jgi:hypothetical protein
VRRLVAASALVASLLAPAAARADVSSWFSMGGGYAVQRNGVTESMDRASTFTMAAGVGSSPRDRFVFGAGVRLTTLLSLGTDLSFMPRFATGGFARGDWGLALDVGVTARWYDDGHYGRYPLQMMLVGGTPWGFQLGVAGHALSLSGEPHAAGFMALLEFDFVRFTVMRQGSSERWWKNPSPAGGHIVE